MKKFPHFVTSLGYRRTYLNKGELIVTTVLLTAPSNHADILTAREVVPAEGSLTLLDKDKLDHIIEVQKADLVRLFTSEIPSYMSVANQEHIGF
jgi:hypothetical protein